LKFSASSSRRGCKTQGDGENGGGKKGGGGQSSSVQKRSPRASYRSRVLKVLLSIEKIHGSLSSLRMFIQVDNFGS
jgi:hypothetical protein